MKKMILFFTVLTMMACSSDKNKQEFFSISDIAISGYENYGDEISSNTVYYKNVIEEKYKNLS